MAFVYIHVLWFTIWIGFGVENYPFGLLTMIVSLEAIFLSTFVMISQNRADAKRQVLADHQWKIVQEEDQQNEELLEISKQILELTKAMHAYASGAGDGSRRLKRSKIPPSTGTWSRGSSSSGRSSARWRCSRCGWTVRRSTRTSGRRRAPGCSRTTRSAACCPTTWSPGCTPTSTSIANCSNYCRVGSVRWPARRRTV